MLVVGLTGGIGSGKSTVAALFDKKGVPIIDADEIARSITQRGEPVLKDILSLFGSDIFLPDGQLDRAKLRDIVFSNEIQRKKLEKLLHPLIRAEMKSRINTLKTAYCIVMIPLLLETHPNPLIKRILIVDTSEDLQISRSMLRDKLSREAVQAILNTQINRAKRLNLTDDIIINDGLLEDLIPQVDKLHAFYLSLAAETKEQK